MILHWVRTWFRLANRNDTQVRGEDVGRGESEA